jgi:hypothetical protein
LDEREESGALFMAFGVEILAFSIIFMVDGP